MAYKFLSIIFFSIIGGIVVAAGVKNFYKKSRVQVKVKGEKRDNLKEMAKLYFFRMKSLLWKEGQVFDTDMNHFSSIVNEKEPILDISIPKKDITVFSEEIMEKIKRLNLPDEIIDEVLTILVDVPDNERLGFLDNIFF